MLENNKMEACSLKGKLSAISKGRIEKDAKIKELQYFASKMKYMLTVSRKG